MRILGFERDQGACNHYRIVQPLYKLKQHNMADILTIHPQNVTDLEFVTQKIIESDIIVFQRPADKGWFNFLKVAQKHGKTIIVDFDDNPFNVHPMNPAYRYHGVEEMRFRWPDGKEEMIWENGKRGFNIEDNITRRDYFRAAFKRADMVSTTTPILRDVFLKINKNTVVLPNLLDFDLYPKLECIKKEIRIGWGGGSSHYEDLYMVVPAIKEILKKYDNVKFIYLGDAGFHGLFKGILKDRLELHHWVQQVAYSLKLITLNLDIGLCPIVDNVFNRNKSAIKYFEYSVVGAATIASNIPPYSPVMMNNRDSLLVGVDGWYDAMEELIVNKAKRKKLATNAYENVFANYNADKKAYLWKRAYEGLLKKDVTELSEAKV